MFLEKGFKRRYMLIKRNMSDKNIVENFWNIRECVLQKKDIFNSWRINKLKRIQRFYGACIPITPDVNKFTAPHGFYGIFISRLAYIASDCVIFHQVTIGSNTLKDGKKVGAPIIEEGCYIGAGAKIIGGVHVGKNVRIGANCVVVDDVPDNATVTLPKGTIYQHESKRDNTFIPMKEFCEWINEEFQTVLKEYCKQHEKIYIYGAGDLAYKYREMILKFKKIEGYIVSDGYPNQVQIEGVRVQYLSEIDITSPKIGIIICMNKKNQLQVIPLLMNKGITDFLCV